MIDIDRVSTEYLRSKSLLKKTEEQVKQWREILVSALSTDGEKDEKGNIWLPGSAHSVKYERRTSSSFDAAKAEKWLKVHGLWEAGTKLIPERRVVDEDAFLGAIFSYDEQETDAKEFYSNKESWAIKVKEEEQYEY
jgi:hypothetical protein